MTPISPLARALVVACLAAVPLGAQTPTTDPATRLRQVLPPDAAARVLARVAEARQHGIAAAALEQRALKFAARGVAPAAIERAVAEQAARMEQVKPVLDRARGRSASADEIDGAADALRSGITTAQVADLARSAPAGRSLAVPLFVLGDLVSRGIPAADAVKTVRDRLSAKATDGELERLPEQSAQSAADEGRHRENGKHDEAASPGGRAAPHAPHAKPPASRPAMRPTRPVGRRP